MKDRGKVQGRRRPENGSQLAELAIILPVLFLIIFGIWDLGAAFALKQKLTNAAREAARIVVSETGCPTCTGVPPRIQAAAGAVVQYLDNDGLDASCITPTAPTSTASYTDPAGNTVQYQWQYTCNGITLIISRGDTSPHGPYISITEPSGSVVRAAATQVTLTYPLSWRAERLLPEPVPASVTSQLTMQNLVP